MIPFRGNQDSETLRNLLKISQQSCGEAAAHSRILAWVNPWTEDPGGLQSTGSQSHVTKSDMTEQISRAQQGNCSCPRHQKECGAKEQLVG